MQIDAVKVCMFKGCFLSSCFLVKTALLENLPSGRYFKYLLFAFVKDFGTLPSLFFVFLSRIEVVCIATSCYRFSPGEIKDMSLVTCNNMCKNKNQSHQWPSW